MDILKDPYLIYGCKVASFLGFWPLQSYEKRFLRTCIVVFSLIYALLIQLCQLLTMDLNLNSFNSVLQMLLPFVSIMITYVTIIVNFSTVHILYAWIVQDWLELKDEIELRIMQKNMNETKLFPKIWGVMFCIYMSSCMLPSILHIIPWTSETVDSIDRYPTFSCFDFIVEQKYLYYFIVIYQILTVVILTIIGIISYSLYIWYIQHACARLSIVKDKLQRPFIKSDEKNNVIAIPNDRSDWIIDIIQHLNRTARFMALVNKVGEKGYLIQMSAVFVILIINLLCVFQIPKLLKQMKGRNEIFMILFFLIGTVTPVYITCYIGQKVMDFSMEVYRDASLVPIYKISLRTQKLLLMTLMMNVKPFAISIGKVFVSSHEFFSSLMRTSLSFAMVIRSVQDI